MKIIYMKETLELISQETANEIAKRGVVKHLEDKQYLLITEDEA